MDFGAVLQTDPPAARTVALAKLAEQHGFSHVWTFDSHVLWQEPYVIYSRILAETRQIKVGPFVTNPATRDATVTASLYATLNEMYGNRTVCGIGRGDSAVRVTGGRPTTLKALREAVHVIRELGNSRSITVGPDGTLVTAGTLVTGSTGDEGSAPDGTTTIQFPWSRGSELEVWVAAYGPMALKLAGEVGDGFILQLADLDIAEWMIATVRRAAEAAGRDPMSVTMCVAAPMYITDGTDGSDGQGGPHSLAHAREQSRWFGGMVGNHVADIVAKYGTGSPGGSAVPAALTDYIAAREGYDYNQHGRAGNTHAAFVPDEIVDRFCLLGTAEQHIEKLQALADLGVQQFAGYLQHDHQEETLRVYGETVIPALEAASLVVPSPS